MGFNVKGIVSGITSGILGNGKGPDTSAQSAYNSSFNENDAANSNSGTSPSNWSPADSMKAAAQKLPEGEGNDDSDNTQDSSEKKPTIGQTILGLRNGGIRDYTANYLGSFWK